ncbi:acyltransferase [Actinocatenispora thailandica]|uniref:Acyltransferase n=1 Tax=Actinocatenispora thailandica TaxID=227318 RepID=A0A7R7DJU6_9ACTN|nr:acyltransferase family protein [Actinocatenispora thailandica]BCJ32891.1 acyltransferase [Actinocatenispora thailandica]
MSTTELPRAATGAGPVPGSETAGTRAKWRGWAGRLEAATPAHRDRTVDALRALAMLGVVLGHWLVSALVADPARPGVLTNHSPLSGWPAAAPVSWLLQLLGPFFFAGGYAAARGSRGRAALPWLAGRLRRLVLPVLALAAVFVPVAAVLPAAGVPGPTRQVVWSLVSHPLWFLLVYLLLTALTPVLRRLTIQCGLWWLLPLVGLVGLIDTMRPGGLPGWLTITVVPVGWAVPYTLGIALAERKLTDRAGAVLLPAGVLAGAALIAAGYPASAVGVPGDGWSNLDPPSLFTLALAAAQLGLFLVLRRRLARLLRRPAVWAPIAVLNLAAMTIFCWHQSALLAVSFAGLPFGPVPGLLSPVGADWFALRLLWLPAFAAVLVGCCLVFHRVETLGARRPAVSR